LPWSPLSLKDLGHPNVSSLGSASMHENDALESDRTWLRLASHLR
jgi:hypothetical protein